MKHPKWHLVTMLISAVAAVSAFPLGFPPQVIIRHAVMSSDIIVVGEMVAVHPFDRRVAPRTGVLLVDKSVYGLAVAGDSLTVHWDADRWYPTDDSCYAVADGDLDLDTVMHRPALWCLGPSRELRCLCRPIFGDQTPEDLLASFVEILGRPSESAQQVMAGDAGLELQRASALKRGAVVRHLQQELERVQRGKQ